MTLPLSSTTYEYTQTANSLATVTAWAADNLCTGHIVAVPSLVHGAERETHQ